MIFVSRLQLIALLLCAGLIARPVLAQEKGEESAAELAKELANPLASLISVPVKFNWDTGIGPADADRSTLLVQPVVPFSVNNNWNLISRTIVPVQIRAESPVAGGSTQTGSGDITLSLWFSPKAPTAGGWIWGVGPVLSLPAASNDRLGSEKWGAGPTAIVLKQEGAWTYGGLFNHVWSVAGTDSRADISTTFIQPFLAYSTPKATTYSVNAESTYDWEARQWTVPINFGVSRVMKLGRLPVSLGLTVRKYVDAPDSGPDWGASVQATFLFPK